MIAASILAAFAIFFAAAVLKQHGEPVGRRLRLAGLRLPAWMTATLVPVTAEERFRELAAQR